MRIKEINIYGLFDMFDHKIPLNIEEHITILYGINGIGKTMIFRILNSFFNSDFIRLSLYPFQKLEVIFDQEDSFYIENNENNFIIKHLDSVFDFGDLKNHKEDTEANGFYPRLRDASRGNNNEQEETIYSLFSLKEFVKQFNVYFIQTQRLYNYKKHLESKKTISKITFGKEEPLEMIEKYSQELSQIIFSKHREYITLSEKLEQSLGKRLISGKVKTYSSIKELQEENRKLGDVRSKLQDVGLLFKSLKDDKLTIPDTINNTVKAILSVNILDMKEKLKFFEGLYQKLNIFLTILNKKRFSHKQITIDPVDGFVFTNDRGEPLQATDLSSGEQNEIVLFYELLFKVPENSLVMIDEPEISLHIAWQKEFLKDMADIIRIRKFDVLIATHSPAIIDGNWDLTVELKNQ